MSFGSERTAAGCWREERVRLDVERELGRRALGPELGVALGGERVVGRVNLDDRELVGVVTAGALRGSSPLSDTSRSRRASCPPTSSVPTRMRPLTHEIIACGGSISGPLGDIIR